MPESTWNITIEERKNGKFRALCPIDGCKDWREHDIANTAAKFMTGHLVAKHFADGVRPSDRFTIKIS